MNKVVGAAEFKAKCLAILDEVQATGQSVTITKRGKPVAEVKPVEADDTRKPLLGLLADPSYRFDDPFSPAVPLEDWDALK